MANIRLNKLTRQFNIGLQTLVSFLNERGAGIEEINPNLKISDKYLDDVRKKFGEDLKAKQEAASVDIKMKEIIENNNDDDKDFEEEEDTQQETTIKDFRLSSETKENGTKENDEKKEAGNTGIKMEGKTAGEKIAKTEKEISEKDNEKNEAVKKKEPAKESEIKTEEKNEEKPKTEVKKQEKAGKETELLDSEKKNAKETLQNESKSIKPENEMNNEKKKETPEKKTKSGKKNKDKKSSEDKTMTKIQMKENKKRKKASSAKEKNDEDDNSGGLKILGKIDLSQFEPKKKRRRKKNKKRDRISTKNKRKVDLDKVDTDENNGRKRKNKERSDRNSKRGRRRNRKFNKKNLTPEEEEEMQKEIQKQVKETYARMKESRKSNFGAKHRKDKREQASQKVKEALKKEQSEEKKIKVTEFMTVNDLAVLMDNTPVNKVIEAFMNLGLIVSINQRLDAEALSLVAEEFGYEVEFVTVAASQDIAEVNEEIYDEKDMTSRPPVVTVMGHVDHGKTSLLDHIRRTNVIAGEAGGITQHIGAYNVELENGKKITFLDTPGHEAFTAMRARGARLTDLAIIIIAADDAVMPQTVEAINHAQAAGVPMVFAINKIDKPGAHPDKIYQQLSQMNILTENWGGKYQCQEISAKKGINVDELLEKVVLETELMDLKANPKILGKGTVIESTLDKGRGYTANVLVQEGTIKKGDMMLCGCCYGRIKAMTNERGQEIKEAGPSVPVSILGLNGAPSAGEKLNIMVDEKEAKSIANEREQLIRIQGIKTQKHMTLEEIGRRIAIGNFKELNIIVKGDVDGSVEALSDSLIKLSTDEIRVNVIHKAVGAISESDVMLATASDAIIVGFQVRPSADARHMAEHEGIEIRLYSIIYDAIEEIKSGIEGMLEPDKKEEITATAYVKQIFKISKVGTVAGCLVKEGKMTSKTNVRLIRDGIVIYTGRLESLKRDKDDVKEVAAGLECGLSIEKFNDIKEGDTIEAYEIVEIKRTL